MPHKTVSETVGSKYSDWTAIRPAEKGKRGQTRWEYRCVCGTTREVFVSVVHRGLSLNCGCKRIAKVRAAITKHGFTGHPIYGTWRAMKIRCLLPKSPTYPLYGGRGITIYPAWMKFEAFLADMGATWKPGLSIDRIDVNGNYEPSNCRWATDGEQGSNRRNNRIIAGPDGQQMTVSEAARAAGLDVRTVFARIRYGWKEEDLLKPANNSRVK